MQSMAQKTPLSIRKQTVKSIKIIFLLFDMGKFWHNEQQFPL